MCAGRSHTLEAPRNPSTHGLWLLLDLRHHSVNLLSRSAELDEWGGIPIFASETGLRPCEWIALERHDISRNDGIVLVERSYTQRSGLKPYGKTARARRPVPLSNRALAAIDYYCPGSAHGCCFQPWAAEAADAEGRTATSTCQLAPPRVVSALESAGLTRHDIYVLRHTFATWALTRPPELEIFELAATWATASERSSATTASRQGNNGQSAGEIQRPCARAPTCRGRKSGFAPVPDRSPASVGGVEVTQPFGLGSVASASAVVRKR
jgi:hypothetical protein